MLPSKNETGYTHSYDDDNHDNDDNNNGDGDGDEGTGATAAKGSSTQHRVRVSKNRFVAQNDAHTHTNIHDCDNPVHEGAWVGRV